MSIKIINNLFDPWKAPVDAASTASLTLAGEQTVDGVALTDGMYCLAKDQLTTADRGIYEVKTGAWVRRNDADSYEKRPLGMACYCKGGTVNGQQVFTQTTRDGYEGSGASGDVVEGPATATDNAWPRFDGATGKLLQNGRWTEADTTGLVTAGGNLAMGANAITGTTTYTENNVLANNDVWETAFEKLDLAFGDFASVAAGEGAALIGSEDVGGFFAGADVEAILQEIGATEAALEALFVDVVCTFPDVGGGGTQSDGSVQVNDLDGNPITSAVRLVVSADDTQYAVDANANVAFTDNGAGSIVFGSGTAQVHVLTDATGLCELRATNAVDETVYISASTVTRGGASAAETPIVRHSNADAVTWAA